MNVEEMTPEEKSVILAKLRGWKLEDAPRGFPAHVLDKTGEDIFPWQSLDGDIIGWAGQYPNLYDPANMALLAKVTEWAFENIGTVFGRPPRTYFELFFDPEQFHKSMCEFADDIIESAIEAGMVE